MSAYNYDTISRAVGATPEVSILPQQGSLLELYDLLWLLTFVLTVLLFAGVYLLIAKREGDKPILAPFILVVGIMATVFVIVAPVLLWLFPALLEGGSRYE